MIRELQIKNYRGFKDFKIDGLDRVNLITGANNVGKTSLLEAIYLNLAPSLPDWPAPIKLLRGFEKLQDKLVLTDIWGWLFNGKDLETEIEITLFDEFRNRRSLKIRFVPREQAFRFFVEGENSSENVLEIGSEFAPRKRTIPPAKLNGQSLPVAVVQDRPNHSIQEDATLFSKVDDAGRKADLIKPLQYLDDRLRDLAVSVASGVPMINCDIGIGLRIPLPQMGDGMVHFFSIVSEIVYTAGGVVLIDEVENGLHYSTMVQVWKAIAEAAHNSNTQIFATTHSFECISAAHKAFSEIGTYDFRLHRLDRIDEVIKAITYDRDMLEAALMTDLEVR